MTEPTDQNLSWAKVIHVRSIQTQLSYEEDDHKSSSTFNVENCGDCYLSDVSSCSELDLKESSIPVLRTDPAVGLGDAFDLFETEDEEETSSSSSSGGSSGSGSVAACALSYSSTSSCKDDHKSSSSTITLKKGNCGDCDVSSCSELELDRKESRCVSALRTDPAVQNDLVPPPTVMVYGLPPRPARAVLQCWEDPQVASCLPSTLKVDRSSVNDAVAFHRTESDLCVTVNAPTLYRTESDLTLASLDEDDGVEPVAPVLVSSSGGASVPGSGDVLSEAWAELEHVLENNMASIQQEVSGHLDGVEHTLTADLQLRQRLREEERWAERHRQGQRLEGLPMWLRRLGDALKGLVKTRPKSSRTRPGDSVAAASAASSSSAAAAGSDDSAHKELCHVAQSACHSQVVLEKARAKYAHVKERQATARDEKILCQALQQLEDLERNFQKQQELMLQDVENTLNRLLGTENSGGPVDLEEEKRSDEDRKSNKPKKMGLKRFFKCLCCLT